MAEAIAQYCPTPRELDDLELLLGGAYPDRATYDAPGEGPVTITLPDGLRTPLELTDAEGLPLARLEADGSLTPLSSMVTGPFRRLHLGPARTRAEHVGSLPVVLVAPPTDDDLAAIQQAREGRPVLLLALTGHGTPQGISSVGLLRVALAAADLLGAASVVAVPFPTHDDPQHDHALAEQVLATYAEEAPLGLAGQGELPAPVAAILEQDQPPEERRGFVVFFTGLSGSGKSTLAQALLDLMLEDGRRTVTSLDGDVVRRNLSAGLGFSREDRERNILRIGWVAAEVARHGGVAICSPIAPFDSTRRQVRQMVEDAGGELVLVHVATPLEECERRDKKGLYAKARRGEIPEFTGISSPYEEPTDAEVRIDTTGRTVEDALADLMPHLPFHREARP